MTTTKNITAVLGAFEIAMNRAIAAGVTPEEFISSMMSEQGKEQFTKLAAACKSELL